VAKTAPPARTRRPAINASPKNGSPVTTLVASGTAPDGVLGVVGGGDTTPVVDVDVVDDTTAKFGSFVKVTTA
jgi:hypothetical protein